MSFTGLLPSINVKCYIIHYLYIYYLTLVFSFFQATIYVVTVAVNSNDPFREMLHNLHKKHLYIYDMLFEFHTAYKNVMKSWKAMFDLCKGLNMTQQYMHVKKSPYVSMSFKTT